MTSNSNGEAFDPRREWLEYIKDRLNAIESIFNWVLIVAGIVIPLMVGQLFMVVDSYIVTSSGALDLSAINLLRSGSLFGVLIIFIILIYVVGNRAFSMRKETIKLIHSILGSILDSSQEVGKNEDPTNNEFSTKRTAKNQLEKEKCQAEIEVWGKKYLNWRFLYDTKDGDKGAS